MKTEEFVYSDDQVADIIDLIQQTFNDSEVALPLGYIAMKRLCASFEDEFDVKYTVTGCEEWN